MTITQVAYARVYNLGNYETLRLEAVALATDGATGAAFEEARIAVEAEYAIAQQRPAQPNGGASYNNDPPASDKQRAYIATLQDKAGWNSEDLLRYSSDQGIDLSELTKAQASQIIEHLILEARQEGIVTKWAKPMVAPPASDDEGLPF